MPDEGDGAEALSFKRLKSVLLDARRELIDLSRRNRLLHSPRSGKRPHCLEILGADTDELFVGLVRTEKQFGFAAVPDDNLAPRDAAPAQNARVQQLQTSLAEEPLNRRLLKFFREARTYEEEQGVNILFLALGILTWYEDDRSQEPCSAPLLLVPVALERRQGRDLFTMKGRDDDMIVNASLAEKLRSFGLTLPELPEDDEWLPSSYLSAVAHVVAGQKRWEVTSTAIGLGFFTFSKFLMWRDLDPASWPDPTTLLRNSLIQNLLGEDSPTEPVPPLVPDEDPIEPHIDLAAAVHVLNADSSQAVCVEEAQSGRNLVVQGPPGTGKSQTIANIIASATCAGKSVLFIAEKAAALDVVSGRLKAVGLDPLCLELHSRKATKQSVIASLDRSISAAGAAQLDGRASADLRKARDALNQWSRTLHKGIRQSGRTPYQVMGTVVRLYAAGTRVLEQRLDVASDWDRDRLAEVERAVERAASAIHQIGCLPVQHPWYGAAADKLSPFDAQRLRAALGEALNCANSLRRLVSEVAALLRNALIDVTPVRLTALAEILRHLSKLPKTGREALKHPGWHTEQPRLRKLIDSAQTWSLAIEKIGSAIVGRALVVDVSQVRHAINAYGRSLLRFCIGRYRRAVADLRGVCGEELPRRFEDRLSLLDTLIAAQSARRLLDAEEGFGRSALASAWSPEATSWKAADALFAWANEAQRLASNIDLFSLAAAVDDAACSELAAKVDNAVASLRTAFHRVAEIVRPDNATIFGARGLDDVPISSIVAKLEQWNGTTDLLNDWVGAREALATLDRWEMQPISGGLKDGSIGASEVRQIVDLLIAEAIWRAALSDDPSLDLIDGSARSETVADFRALDRRRIEISRSEVLARYFERRPGGATGEMGIVRGEIGKKKRHLPIRKLLERAGAAVQRLKPIFLMSPLSVAQFLPPGRFTFDLVVIDEASQVPPEEAFGAIGRAHQVIIVGDDKQLPPTNFFRMVSADDDGAEDDTEFVDTPRARNFESILTLGRSRGMPERMLRWHYRSRHPSLIALSNQACYAGGLLLPPSPVLDRDSLGLSLVKTPRGHYDRGGTGRNPVEADIVAGAVEEHLAKWPDRSLGIACFSVAQRDAIEDALQARGLLSAAEAFAPNGERLFVKNLEAVQGDERDVIFISIGYGPDAQGRMTSGFGPLSGDGGERRLNVLISRARSQCVVFSSITAGDIPSDVRPRGTRMLREFLHFAESGHIAAGQVDTAGFDSPFEEAVAIEIRRAGYSVIPQVGVSGFRIDLGVLHPQMPGRFILGIECDGAAYHSGRSARDRDRLRQEVLEGLGWTLYRIWSTDWFRNPKREAERVIAAIRHACENTEALALTPNSEESLKSTPKIDPTVSSDIKIQPVSTPEAQPYQEFPLRVPPGAGFFSIGIQRHIDLAAAVVQHEGPIHFEEVARRIREGFGLERTGARILESVRMALDSAARQKIVHADGEFWSSESAPLKAPRSRRNASPSLRRHDRIASSEYELAIEAMLRSCVAATRSELIAGTARVLGFDRTGNGLDKAISIQIELMIASGKIRDTGGHLQLGSG